MENKKHGGRRLRAGRKPSAREVERVTVIFDKKDYDSLKTTYPEWGELSKLITKLTLDWHEGRLVAKIK